MQRIRRNGRLRKSSVKIGNGSSECLPKITWELSNGKKSKQNTKGKN
jgi:hypothetical protein